MNRNRLLALVAGSALVSGCASSYESPRPHASTEPTITVPVQRVYRSGLETEASKRFSSREYGTPNSDIEFELGSDPGNNRLFQFTGLSINHTNHRYGRNIFPEQDELNFILRPDTKERVVFIEGDLLGNGATARSEIDEMYVFSPVMNAQGKPATEITYSTSDPIYGKRATFKRDDMKKHARGIMHESNENIIMPDLEPVRIGDTWYLTPIAGDGDKTRSPFYLIEASGAITGAERETGAVFVRTTRNIFRGTLISSDAYKAREEQHRLRDETAAATRKAQEEEEARIKSLQENNPGLIEIIK